MGWSLQIEKNVHGVETLKLSGNEKFPSQVKKVVSTDFWDMKESITIDFGGARGVLVIVVGNIYGDTSSNPGQDWLHFTQH